MRQHHSACVFSAFLWLLAVSPSVEAADTPTVRIENVRRVFENGEHNAFTDLIRWKGQFWLTFRSCPSGHAVDRAASIIVLRSDDAKQWEKVHQFSVPDRDTRDPHFLEFKGKLFVYTGTWWSGVDGILPRAQYDINKHFGFAVWTEDGKSWKGPKPLEGTYGHYIWRAASHKGKAYLCARRKRGHSEEESGAGGTKIMESAILESEDGLNWRFLSLFQQQRGNETAFQFLQDDSVLAVSRAGKDLAQLAKSKPPYREWTRRDLPAYIGGPLLARWGNRWMVGGRGSTERGPKTILYWLINDKLQPFAELPSGGDNSYPGFIALDNERGLVSWYSSHETNAKGNTITAIYVAELVVESN